MVKLKILILFSVFILFSCVENITELNNTGPTIKIISPTKGDTVQVGNNLIMYQASDNTGGLEKFEVIINSKEGRFVDIFQAEQGSNTPIYLNVDPTLLGQNIDYFVNVKNYSGVYSTSEVQESLFVIDTVEPLKQPGDLSLVMLNPRSVNLFWEDSSTTEDSYELWRKSGSTSTYILYKTLPENTVTFTDTGLSESLTYYYKVRAVNNFGASPFSNEVNTALPPARPTNLQIFDIQGSNTQFSLVWNDNSYDEEGFFIFRQEGLSGQYQNYSNVGFKPGTGLYAATVEIENPNSEYFFKVKAYKGNLTSEFSNEVSTNNINRIVLNIPQDSITNNSAKLNWVDIFDNEFVYFVERKRISSPAENNFFVSATVGGAVNTGTKIYYKDSNLSPNTQYVYRVRALLDSQQYSDYSNEVTITTLFN